VFLTTLITKITINLPNTMQINKIYVDKLLLIKRLRIPTNNNFLLILMIVASLGKQYVCK